MLAKLQRTIGLWMKEKTGLTATVLILFAIAGLAALLAVIFLCVSGFEWAAIELGPVLGGLASAGVFLAIAACCFFAAKSTRRQAQHRATLERARRTQGASLLLNPKTFQIAMQAKPPPRLATAYSACANCLSRSAVRS